MPSREALLVSLGPEGRSYSGRPVLPRVDDRTTKPPSTWSAHVEPETTIHIETGAVHERRILRCEPGDGGSNLFRRAQPPERRSFDDLLSRFAQPGLGRRRRDQTWIHTVDPHPERPCLAGERLSQRCNGRLRGHITRSWKEPASSGRERSDRNDRPAAVGGHPLQGSPADKEGAPEIDCLDAVP